MMKHQRGAVIAVMDMSLFLLFLLSGLLCSASASQRKYFYINTNLTWAEAQSYCRERFTDLATVDSIDDVNMMINTVNDGYRGSVWIGLKRAIYGYWGWSHGENQISYSNWGVGEPDGVGKFCTLISNGFWNNVPCSLKYYFTCYDESTGYKVISLQKTWIESQSYCRQYHTDLATISSPEDTNQINNVVGYEPSVWIGLFLDFWQWSDQWSLFFRNWDAGYTSYSSGFGYCAAMSTGSGKWIQVPCFQQRPFICYDDLKQQIVRLKLSHDGKYNLNDSSVQTAILNEITEKLMSAGLKSHYNITWRKDEGGEVFHLDKN